MTPILGGVALFFSFLLVVIASPFATQLAPANGFGLNPSLQNLYMVAHPPLLYLGCVGLTIPFAFGMGSPLARRSDEAWLIAVRRWTLVAWTALGFGSSGRTGRTSRSAGAGTTRGIRSRTRR